MILTLGIATKLLLLGYYKYTNFFLDTLNQSVGTGFNLRTIFLPLAISFFTFQQITYLVGAFKGETREHNFIHYCLFVTFFPQLIAGPIVHHREMLPQFARDAVYRLNRRHLSVGITMFVIGLFKKVVLADHIALYASPAFAAVEEGVTLSLLEAWRGALSYSFQLYFDFSGYSDMAIGLARMFGIRLILNSNSPYKAANIIDFWQRWHISLSRFLRNYLYTPLMGQLYVWMRPLTRIFPTHKTGLVTCLTYMAMMITMVLGGLWHGAGWTFVIWGGLHGIYLVMNYIWIALRPHRGMDANRGIHPGRRFSQALTFLVVVVAWVFFRAESLPSAQSMLLSMFGMIGAGSGMDGINANNLVGSWQDGIPILALCSLLVWFAPSTQQIMCRYMRNPEIYPQLENDTDRHAVRWRPTLGWALVVGFMAVYALNTMLGTVSEFLYFQF